MCAETAGAQFDSAQLDFREIIRRSKDAVFPAVVFIKCLRESHEEGKKESREVAGSGVLINAEGDLLTNRHVVDKAVEIRCLLFDGRSFHAELIGSDKDMDLALIRLKLPKDEKPVASAPLGDSTTLKEGDFVMAMGAPWGLARSVSMGIISCTRRYMPKRSEYSLWLQTDASISPGNSGGPLVNTRGEVIGINAMGTFYGGDMGFAIPSSTIKQVIPRLGKHGCADWSWTGLKLQAIRDFNKNVYFEGTNGVIVASTDENSPARRAGVVEGDRLLRVNGTDVTGFVEEDLPEIRRVLAILPVDKPATLDLLRDGKSLAVQMTPREKGKVEGEELDCPRWDLTAKAINQFDNKDLYFYRKKGVFIYGVKNPGNASSARIGRNDIIMSIDGVKVETLEDLKTIHEKALKDVGTKPRVLFRVLRNGMMRQVILDFSRDYEKE